MRGTALLLLCVITLAQAEQSQLTLNGKVCNCDPEDAPTICAAKESSGVLIAHQNCNLFYKCDHGVPVALKCPSGLLYNPYTEQCDWAHNVECGNRTIAEIEEVKNKVVDDDCDDDGHSNSENGSGGGSNGGDSGNGGNCHCNAHEAPEICAADGSEDVLIAHENCNQYYICNYGVPVPMFCYPGLVYNPYTEQCDWPHLVDCGNRPIVEIEGGDNGENGNGDNGNGDNNGSDNNGTCNCNPGEAPSICATEGSEDVLIAHENCNQYYICNYGVPVPMFCYPGLVYNPYTEQCDWPHLVDCGNRPIVEIEGGDNGDNGNGDNGNGDNNGSDNNGTCNCNPGEAPSICATEGSEDVLIAHENCNQYYICNYGVPVPMFCYPGLVYNPYTEQCDWPHLVDCGNRPIVEIEGGDNGDNGNGDNGNGDNNGSDNNGTCNCNPGEAPSICATESSEDVLIAHENCNQYYICNHGVPVPMFCNAGLVYNPYTEQCDWPQLVDCKNRPIVEIEGGGNGDNGNGDNGNGDNGGNDNNGTCNCNPGEAPGICATDGSEDVLIAHENCNQYYICNHGVPVSMFCNAGLVYNPYTEQCDWPHLVDCGNRPIVECEDGGNGDNGNGDNGNGDNGGNNNNGTCNCNPGEAPSICGTAGSEDVLIAHENCNQYYICNYGIPVPMFCNAGLVYNPYTEQCDWPHLVDCGNRPIVEIEGGGNGDNGNGDTGNGDNGGSDNSGTCNCNPGEAPNICATEGSEDVLIAHENCNQYYICNYGVPVPMFCYPGLVYNPYTEQCDWPHLVDCGNRPIVEIESGGNDDNGNGVNENEDNGGSDNISTCNCNPGEAPSICATDGSEDVLIAHENCNQYYICNHGVPVPMFCNAGLVYNPYTEQCDWPHLVECGNRPIVEIEGGGNGDNGNGDNGNGDNGGSDNSGTCNCNPGEAPSICGTAGSEDVLIAHENCNQYYICNYGVPVPMFCYPGLVYNPYTEQCDWPHLVDCKNRPIVEIEGGGNGDNGNGDNGNGDNGGNDNNGTCNCNPGEAPGICATDGSEDVLIAHENCNQYYICNHGVPVSMFCNAGLVYNPYTEQCDWPHLVDCGNRPIVECEDGGNGDNGNGDNGNEDNGGNNNNGTCNCNPGEAPSICGTAGSEDVLIAHENCNQYYICNYGIPVPMFCNAGLVYNPYTEQCDWPHLVDCGNRPIVEIEGGGNGDNGNGDTGNGDIGGSDNSGTCNCNPGEAPSICGTAGSEDVLIAHENCNQYYICNHGVPVPMFCNAGLVYNPYTEQCDWPHLVDCGNRPIVEIEGGGNGDNGNGDNGNGDNGGNNNNGTCNCNPGEAPGICGTLGSEGVLIAHENCNQYYICNHGVPVSMFCNAGLVYNPYTEQCDWPHLVDCGNRPIVEIEGGGNGDNGNGDNGNGDNGGNNNNGTCNCNPGEAPGICGTLGSEGVLIAHENCNQYYICNHGVPVPMFCNAGLVYNPYTEQCDWPHLVDCGNRPIVEIEGGGNGDNGNGDNGNGDNGGNNNNGTCNCNPGEAPGICGTLGSEGVLIAHENCNQYYICNHGVPVPMFCNAGLVYNPYTEQCDWPHLVDCGNRPIVEIEGGSNGDNGNGDNGNGDNGGNNNNGTCNCNPGEAPGICGTLGSEGVLIAHENCNQYYICNHGVPVSMFCNAGLVYNPYTEQCDWPHLVDCGNRPILEIEGGGNGDNVNGDNGNGDNGGNNNNGTCNCNPGEAPGICGTLGSEGVLIAHENCNQYYICNHGVPVPMFCNAGLVYNPYTEQCDWPLLVDCGNRPIVEIEGGGNGDNGNGDNENGDNGGNNNNGTCNCNPGEAPGICGTLGSEGVLIAHENCNQYYICNHGVPVSMCCNAGLVYNPYTEQCDWPHLVDCGNRPIVEIEGGGNGDNGNGDNGNGDNGGNNNNGTCNCNPGEAPGICGTDGSEGVLIAHENCNQYYICNHGVSVPMFCNAGLVYNPYTEQCDWPHLVDCGNRPIVEIEGGSNGDNGNGDNGNGDNGGNNNNGTCNCNPGEAPSICGTAGSEDVLIAHENCNQYYICNHGVPVPMFCNAGLVYNPYTEQCDWPHLFDCGNRPIVEIEGGGNGDNGNGDNGNGDNGGNNNNGTCNCNPGEAPGICGTLGSEGVLIAHENCNQYYICNHGVPVSMFCNAGLVYNPYTEQCDWPHLVDCGNRPIVECEDGGNGDNGNGDTGNGENGGSDNSGTCNCNPGEAPSICGTAGSEDVLIAHENCNQYYICNHGVPVPMFCNAGLVYNPYTEQCDWPHLVDCGNRPIVEIEGGGNGDNGNGDNGNGDNGGNNNNGTCNCNPGEAPGICGTLGSEGVLIAHENCNQYYICNHGVPVPMFCNAGLVYNPYNEQCDWPHLVDCGNRPIVEIEGGGNGDNGNGDNGNGDNGGNNNNGTCNCNPGEAPGICGTLGSEGVLIAHENCNQYYICNHGVPVPMFCNAGLVYNPYNEQCDWPHLVDCGNRPIVEIEGGSNGDNGNGDNANGNNGGNNNNGTCNCNPGEAPGICGTLGSEGVLIAHENCNQYYICNHGVPVPMFCNAGLVYNPYTEQCDWPHLVDCGNRPIVEIEGGGNGDNGNGDNGNGDNGGSNNNGTCNCNPDEAPGICGAAGSEDVLIAHENCNQYYICNHGVPVPMFCNAGLVYNPYTEQCDWPHLVDCGNRPIVEIEGGGNGDNGNGDNGNGDNGGSNNNGTCNCNPDEAPGICGAAGSEDVLIAHENCNQYYICNHGVPVPMFCNAGLVYNPYTEQCDWPHLVDCGNRPIVEIEGGSNGDNGNGDNGNGDNGGNNNNGTCNCNPDEAPGICGAAGSEDVLIAHENCNQYYICNHGIPVPMFCNAGLVYNPYTEQCDWPHLVDCGNRPIVECEGGGNVDNGNGDNGNGDNGGSHNNGTCNCNPGEAPGICGTAGSEDVLIAHDNCNQYYICNHGVPVPMFCNAGLVYNPYTEQCDWPHLVDCGNRPIVEIEGGGNGDNGNGDNGNGDNGGSNNNGTCNCNPDEAPGICGAAGSEDVLIAHENCNQYYICNHGVPVPMFCNAGLVYNPYTEQCDWPHLVDCGNRPIVEIEVGGNVDNGNGDNGNEGIVDDNNGGDTIGNNGGNCDPSEAPAICANAGSNGVFVAHENCDQYYVCSNSKPVALNCPSNLLYNPAIEECDWPRNVVCGDRFVPVPESGGDGPCSCNAREAPSICSRIGSNGKLIAHENCYQYYVCFEGTPIPHRCPQSLFYDPLTEQCLWPASVNCEGRGITGYASLNKHLQARRDFS